MRNTDPADVALARAILAEPTLAFVVGVAVGAIAASPAARKQCTTALAELRADGHPASAALQLAGEALLLEELLSTSPINAEIREGG